MERKTCRRCINFRVEENSDLIDEAGICLATREYVNGENNYCSFFNFPYQRISDGVIITIKSLEDEEESLDPVPPVALWVSQFNTDRERRALSSEEEIIKRLTKEEE